MDLDIDSGVFDADADAPRWLRLDSLPGEPRVQSYPTASQYLAIVLMVASPIGYTPSMLPENLRIMIYLNPLAYFVIAFQSLIVLDEMPPLFINVGCVGFAASSFLLGAWVFNRARVVFFDYA
jgi:ABC-type polysaccharide/polyol phosphate export permease